MLRLLNEALATEIVCVLRSKRHYYMASGLNAQSVAAEFLQHANEEQMQRVAIDSYHEMIAYLGNDDPTTRTDA